MEHIGGEVASTIEDVISAVKARPVLLGILLAILSNILSSSGLITQRYASLQEQQDPKGASTLWKCIYALGLVLYIGASGPDVASYMFAPEATLAVVGSLEPIFVALGSLLLLKADAKNFTMKEGYATILCVAGAIGCIFSSPSTRPLVLVDLSPGPLVYFGCILVCIVCLCWLEYFSTEGGMIRSMRSLALPCLAALSLACSKLFNTNLGTLLLEKDFNVAEAWQRLPAFVSLICMVSCSLSCFFHISRGMQVMAPYTFMPVYFGVNTIMQFIQSMTILGEYDTESPMKAFSSIICAMMVLAGVLLMNSAEMTRRTSSGNEAVPLKTDLKAQNTV
jgi:hypothetical protein